MNLYVAYSDQVNFLEVFSFTLETSFTDIRMVHDFLNEDGISFAKFDGCLMMLSGNFRADRTQIHFNAGVFVLCVLLESFQVLFIVTRVVRIAPICQHEV
jgi:hypothetical protein